MNLFKVTLTKTMMFHREVVRGDHCDVKRWAPQRSKSIWCKSSQYHNRTN